jgi:hypothetical protein
LFGSVIVSAHPPSVVPTPTHVEDMQASPDLQGLPHPPQLFGSLDVITHVSPHLTVPGAQVNAQLPTLQTLPDGQARPHMPQLSRSLMTSTQRDPHSCVPPLQFGKVPPSGPAALLPHPPAVAVATATITSTTSPAQTRFATVRTAEAFRVIVPS